MVIKERLYSVDDVWQMAGENHHYELIEGALFEMSPASYMHGRLAVLIARYMGDFAEAHGLGEVTMETGYHPPDNRHILLAPDVAFVSRARAPQPFHATFAPLMPDLAVEIQSPTDTLRQVRRKAAIYLRHGTKLVWIVLPDERGIDICRAVDGSRLDIEFVGRDGTLSGEQVLPGFELPVSRLFPAQAETASETE